MAKKVQPVNILPAPSSSDDETEDQDGSGSSTDDEQHPPQTQIQQPQSEEESDDDSEDDEPQSEPVVKNPSLQKPQESEEDSDDESVETQNSPSASAFTIKPIVSKPPEMKTPTSKPVRVKSRAKRPADSEETDKPIKVVSKIQEAGNVKGGNGKRPAEVEKVEKSKKSKGLNGEGHSVGKVEKDAKSKNGDDVSGEVEEKKSIVKWSGKDEAALLGGIVEFKAETGEDLNSKMDAFHEYVKDSISISLTKTQLYEKIRRLKKKFQTNVEKRQNGEELVFSKPHERKLFELSQKIWGSEGVVTEGNGSKVKSSKKKDKKDGNVVSNTNTSSPLKPVTNTELSVQEELNDVIMEDKKEETKDCWSLYPWLCASLESEASNLRLRAAYLKDYVKGVISKIGEEKAKELEAEWKDVHVMDHQLYVRRAHLISKQADAVSEYLNC
ncbi:hypothetical protein POM88_031711 [Heracleum sosnowskyi]|uniref:Glabrous enhancer-binding protein-like DBD domain-containing protein n=1 Tax=Heracleum sosnowskyi TaxID=360622 RepID=A0AAD8HYR8_9APIA|nr:hypothetical protein POM88_031711 [Heracleum sosnowskyi]